MNDHDQWVLDHAPEPTEADLEAEREYWREKGREMYDVVYDGDAGVVRRPPREESTIRWADLRNGDVSPTVVTRDVRDLRLTDLLPAERRSHSRRDAVVINGVAVTETLKERLTREKIELETAISALAGQLARRADQLKHLERFPDEDPFQDGAVLQFEKSFPNSPTTLYSYVAHRANGHWYLTGDRSPQRLTWSALVSWMGLGVEKVYQLGATEGARRNGRRKVIG